MADDVTFQSGTLATPPSGTVVSTDDVGGKQVQRMKLMDGTDGGSDMAVVTAEGNLQTITPNRTASGTLGALDDAVTLATSSSGLVRFQFVTSTLSGASGVTAEGSADGGTTWTPLNIANENFGGGAAFDVEYPVPVAGDSLVVSCAAYTHVRLRVSTYEGGSADVVAIASSSETPAVQLGMLQDINGVFLKSGGGTEGTGVLRVTLASDSTGLLSVDDNGGALTVDGTVAVSAVGGTVAVTQSGTWDEVGINDSGNSITVDGTVGVSGTVTVDGSGVTQPVSGTVTVGSITAGDNNIGNVDVVSLPALVAGTANIGDVDVLTVPADPFGANADAASATGSISAKLRFIAATGIPVTSVPSHAVTNAGTFATQVDGAALTSLQLIDDPVFADEAAFTVATSKVMAAGYHAVSSSAAPDSTGADTAVNPITNRNRVPFVIGGDPGVITLKHTTITTAVTDAAIVTISTGNKIVVTRLTVTLDNASTVFPTCVIGFGTANTPTTTGVLFAHGGIPAGGGATIGDGSGILGVGADNEDLRVTTTGNATGNGLQITVSYYLIVA